jgi:hypothetical protein
MKPSAKLGLLAIAASWFGCVGPSEEPPMQDDLEPPTAVDHRLQPALLLADGSPAPAGGFVAKEDVHLRTTLPDEALPLADVELAFVVVDANNVPLSSDPLECRRFRVGHTTGGIAEVLTGYDVTGALCWHRRAVNAEGDMLVQLAPFADVAPDAAGLMELAVLVAPVGHLTGDRFPSDAPRRSFLVRAP